MALARLTKNPVFALLGLVAVYLIALSGCESTNDPAVDFGSGGSAAAGASGTTAQGTSGTTAQGTSGTTAQGTSGMTAPQGSGGTTDGTAGAPDGTAGTTDGTAGTTDGTAGTIDGTAGATDGTAGTTDGTAGTTDGTAGTTAGTGGTTDGGGGTGGDQYSPLCSTLATEAGVNPAKGGTCTDADPQLCYKGCGPETDRGVGFKSETCTEGVYDEGDCIFPPDADYSCYAIPDSIDATCPAEIPQASQPCDVAYCVVCNLEGEYLTSSGEQKVGYCVCPESATERHWSCASATAWPCPANSGC